MYSSAADNPVKYTDPNGQQATSYEASLFYELLGFEIGKYTYNILIIGKTLGHVGFFLYLLTAIAILGTPIIFYYKLEFKIKIKNNLSFIYRYILSLMCITNLFLQTALVLRAF